MRKWREKRQYISDPLTVREVATGLVTLPLQLIGVAILCVTFPVWMPVASVYEEVLHWREGRERKRRSRASLEAAGVVGRVAR